LLLTVINCEKILRFLQFLNSDDKTYDWSSATHFLSAAKKNIGSLNNYKIIRRNILYQVSTRVSSLLNNTQDFPVCILITPKFKSMHTFTSSFQGLACLKLLTNIKFTICLIVKSTTKDFDVNVRDLILCYYFFPSYISHFPVNHSILKRRFLLIV